MKKWVLVLILSILYIEKTAAEIIQNTEDTKCGIDCSWSYDTTTHTLTVTGSGDMMNYGPIGDQNMGTQEIYAALETRPWNDIASEVEHVIVSGVTSVGARTFQRMDNLTSIDIADSVTSVYRAFLAYDSSLTSITLPDSITSIEPHAFTCLANLESINIPDSVTSIGEKAFYGSTSLTSLVVPDTVTSIGEGAFTSSLATIYCVASSPCLEKGSDNIVPYMKDRSGAFALIDAEGNILKDEYGNNLYYFSTNDMVNREHACTSGYETCAQHALNLKAEQLAAKGVLCADLSSCQALVAEDYAGNILKVNGKEYASLNDLLKGNYIPKRIYSIKEANEVAGKKNKVMIRYR